MIIKSQDNDQDDNQDDIHDHHHDNDVNLGMLGISLIAAKGRAWLVSMWLQQHHLYNTQNT